MSKKSYLSLVLALTFVFNTVFSFKVLAEEDTSVNTFSVSETNREDSSSSESTSNSEVATTSDSSSEGETATAMNTNSDSSSDQASESVPLAEVRAVEERAESSNPLELTVRNEPTRMFSINKGKVQISLNFSQFTEAKEGIYLDVILPAMTWTDPSSNPLIPNRNRLQAFLDAISSETNNIDTFIKIKN